ncbi:MAG: SIMPL domain-containing protein [Parvibaculaceae bacterium]
MTARLLPLLGLGLAMALAATPAAADDKKPERSMTLQGRGEVFAKPDMATVSIGVVRQAKTAREALDANTAAMQEVLASLKAQGFEGRDVQTSNFSVSPRYDYSKDGAPPKIDGYEVSNQVTVTVRDLKKLGALLDKAVTDGSNQITGVAFSIAKPEPLTDEARKLAVKDAARKARVFADAAQVTLGPITEIAEQGGYRPPQPYAKQQMRMAAEAAPVPIAEGEQMVEIEVSITWEIK